MLDRIWKAYDKGVRDTEAWIDRGKQIVRCEFVSLLTPKIMFFFFIAAFISDLNKIVNSM